MFYRTLLSRPAVKAVMFYKTLSLSTPLQAVVLQDVDIIPSCADYVLHEVAMPLIYVDYYVLQHVVKTSSCIGCCTTRRLLSRSAVWAFVLQDVALTSSCVGRYILHDVVMTTSRGGCSKRRCYIAQLCRLVCSRMRCYDDQLYRLFVIIHAPLILSVYHCSQKGT